MSQGHLLAIIIRTLLVHEVVTTCIKTHQQVHWLDKKPALVTTSHFNLEDGMASRSSYHTLFICCLGHDDHGCVICLLVHNCLELTDIHLYMHYQINGGIPLKGYTTTTNKVGFI